MRSELVKLTLADAAAWRSWLAKEGTTSPGVMLTIAKKPACATTTLTYPLALDEALCYGWIDSTGYRVDESTHSVRFTPRKSKSVWSKRNVGYIERLEKEGRMQPAGQAVVDAAKEDGRWDAAYSASSANEPHPDFVAALTQNPAAQEAWDGLNKGGRWTIFFTLLNLKTDAGREKRIRSFVDMLARGEAPASQRPKKRKPDSDEADQVSVPKKSTKKRSKIPSGEDDVSISTPPATTDRTTRSGRRAPSYAGKA